MELTGSAPASNSIKAGSFTFYNILKKEGGKNGEFFKRGYEF